MTSAGGGASGWLKAGEDASNTSSIGTQAGSLMNDLHSPMRERPLKRLSGSDAIIRHQFTL
jgi:hypothetical protein